MHKGFILFLMKVKHLEELEQQVFSDSPDYYVIAAMDNQEHIGISFSVLSYEVNLSLFNKYNPHKL